MLSFADIAKKKLNEIERPPLAPIGNYVFRVKELPKISTSSDNKWDNVEYQLVGIEALDDVDQDELKAFGGAHKVAIRVRFMFNKEEASDFQRTEFRMKEFLISHLKCADDSDPLYEAMNKAVGATCIGTVTHRQDKENKEIFYAEIRKTAPQD